MAATASLHRPSVRQIEHLLDSFRDLLPGCALAVEDTAGTVIASVGDLPQDAATPARRYPLAAEGVTVAELVVHDVTDEGVGAAEIALQRSFDLLLAGAVQAQAHVRTEETLRRLAAAIGTALEPRRIARLVLDEARRALSAEVGLLFLVGQPESGAWPRKTAVGEAEQVQALDWAVRRKLTQTLKGRRTATVDELVEETAGLGALLWAPLKTPQEMLLGRVVLARRAGQPAFTPVDERLLAVLSEQAALALENARRFAQTDAKLARRVNELLALQRIDRQLNETLDYDRVLTLTAEFAATHTGAREAWLLLPTPSGGAYHVAGRFPACEEAATIQVVERDEPLIAEVLRSGGVQIAATTKDSVTVTRVCVPVLREGRVIGLLQLAKEGLGAFEADHLTFLVQLADRSALAIDNTLLYTSAQQEIGERRRAEDALRRAHDRLSILRQVDIELSRRLEMGYVLERSLDAALRLSSAETGFIGLAEEDGVRPVEMIGGYADALTEAGLWPEAGIAARAIRQQRAELVSAVSADPDYTPFLADTQAQIVLPLISNERFIGILNLETSRAGLFTTDLFDYLKLLAARIAVAIDNARMVEGEQRYRKIIETASDIVCTANPQGRLTYINAPAQRLTGYSEADLLGMAFEDLLPPEWRARVLAFYTQQAEARTRETILEFPIITRGGEQRWVEQTVTLLTEGERVTGFQGIMRDITDRKHAEEERERLIEELDAFARTVAHDLKNPLNVISGYVWMLEDHCDGMTHDELRTYLAAIGRGATKMRNIIEEIGRASCRERV